VEWEEAQALYGAPLTRTFHLHFAAYARIQALTRVNSFPAGVNLGTNIYLTECLPMNGPSKPETATPAVMSSETSGARSWRQQRAHVAP
jgi:hypothetical protein